MLSTTRLRELIDSGLSSGTAAAGPAGPAAASVDLATGSTPSSPPLQGVLSRDPRLPRSPLPVGVQGRDPALPTVPGAITLCTNVHTTLSEECSIAMSNSWHTPDTDEQESCLVP